MMKLMEKKKMKEAESLSLDRRNSRFLPLFSEKTDNGSKG